MANQNPNPENKEAFRETISTVDSEGKRIWVFPKKPKGPFHTGRVIVSIVLLTFLFGIPFLKIHGEPYMLFNILERKFILFGVHFGPQDFFILGIATIAFIVGIIVFTVIFGRIFCGWICPQTIFMEMVFRKIEYLIEGDFIKQKNLAAQPWTTEKIFKKASKHTVFYLIAFIIANTFLAYIIGIDKLKGLVLDGPFAHPITFIALLIFSFLFYGVFGHLREQVCLGACPYGRLQGVLLDKSSIVVAYDHIRGEPRGKLNSTTGDCINCKQCVHVCPTGIDIRNGTQLECVNCTACIDACDDIMVKIQKPKGLIRYASQINIEQGKPFRFTTRMLAYSAILIILITTVSYKMFSRAEVDGTILRAAGSLYQTNQEGHITNIYNYQLINKTVAKKKVEIVLKSPKGKLMFAGRSFHANHIELPPEENVGGAVLITLEPDQLKSLKTPVVLEIRSEGKVLKTIETNFMGPTK